MRIHEVRVWAGGLPGKQIKSKEVSSTNATYWGLSIHGRPALVAVDWLGAIEVLQTMTLITRGDRTQLGGNESPGSCSLEVVADICQTLIGWSKPVYQDTGLAKLMSISFHLLLCYFHLPPVWTSLLTGQIANAECYIIACEEVVLKLGVPDTWARLPRLIKIFIQVTSLISP